MQDKKIRKDRRYKPEYCEMLLGHCKKGLSFESFAAIIGVSRQALYDWAKKHKEFGEAKEEGHASRILQAEQTLWLITTGKMKGNVTGAIFLLKNIAGWRDSVESQMTNDIKIELAYKLDPPKEIEVVETGRIGEVGAGN
jgi:transposase-like protein